LVEKNNDDSLDSEIAKRLDDLFGERGAFSEENTSTKTDSVASNNNQSSDHDKASSDGDIIEFEEIYADETEEERYSDDYPLTELKNLVLSIDWEITDEVLTKFLSQIDSLKETYKDEKIILMFLQLLGSLGEYIRANRGNAHPRTFKILNSVFSRLDEMIQSEDITEAEKKKILRGEMNKYKQLREQVAKKKAIQAKNKKDKPSKQVELQSEDTQRRKVVSQAEELSKRKAVSPVEKPSVATKTEVSGSVGEPVRTYESLAEAVEELKKFIHSELGALREELKNLQTPK
jgi:hypothetical protein